MNNKPKFAPGTPVEWVGVVWEGNKLMAVVGPDLMEGEAGFGDTIPEALRDLADKMEEGKWTSSVLPAEPKPKLRLVTNPKRTPGGDTSGGEGANSRGDGEVFGGQDDE